MSLPVFLGVIKGVILLFPLTVSAHEVQGLVNGLVGPQFPRPYCQLVVRGVRPEEPAELVLVRVPVQGCQMAKFDPFLSWDCARVEGVGAQSKERKGSNFAAQRSGAIVLQARRAKHIRF